MLKSEDVLSLIIVFGGLIFFCVVTVLSPKSTPDLGFEIDSVRTTSVNVSGSAVTADWNINFTIQNTDMFIYFQDINVSLSYKSEQLATEQLAGFYMEELSRAKLAARLSAQSVWVENWVADSIVYDEMHQRMIIFDLKLYAIQLVQKPKIFKLQRERLIVDCKDIKIEFSENFKSGVGGVGGVLQGGPVKCNHMIIGGYPNSNFTIQEKTSSNSQVSSI